MTLGHTKRLADGTKKRRQKRRKLLRSVGTRAPMRCGTRFLLLRVEEERGDINFKKRSATNKHRGRCAVRLGNTLAGKVRAPWVSLVFKSTSESHKTVVSGFSSY